MDDGSVNWLAANVWPGVGYPRWMYWDFLRGARRRPADDLRTRIAHAVTLLAPVARGAAIGAKRGLLWP